MQELAKTRTSSIKSNAGTISSNIAKKENNNSNVNKGSKNDLYINHNIKKGSISDYANMLNRGYDSKNTDSEDNN